MRREVLIALNSDPALLRPDLSGDVTGGIQTQELNSLIRPGR